MLSDRSRRRQKPSPFILKLVQILENEDHSHLVSWTSCSGGFVVHRPLEFSSSVLPRYFRHSNYGSFLRQLSFYSFVKAKTHNEAVH
jgi:hypothetical protein